jgi:hypothetical protein
MRASLNMETTARLDSLQMEAASWISSCIDVGSRPRHAAQGGRLFDDDGWHVFQLGKL